MDNRRTDKNLKLIKLSQGDSVYVADTRIDSRNNEKAVF